LPGCGHDGQFDYREAWESDPSTYRRAKEKLAKIKGASGNRRGSKGKPKAGE
jgi:hypothetical protein